MTEQNFKDFAVAYSIMKLMDCGKPMRTNDFAKQLNIGFHTAKRVVGQMSKSNLILGKRGFNSEGFTKTEGMSVDNVFDLYNIEKTLTDIQSKIDNVLLKKKFKIKTCTVCESPIRFRSESSVCKSCQKYDTPIFEEKRIAKCGHPSLDRYFSCRACQPALPEDDNEDQYYSVHL